jgi:tol-pal system protein YbgF
LSEQIACRPLNLRRFSGAACWWFTLVAGAILISGCATRSEIVGFQEDTRHIRSDIDTLRQEQAQVSLSVMAMEAEIRDLSAKSEYGSSALEEKVETLAARLDEILGRMDRTIAPLEDFIRKQQEKDTSSHVALGTDLYDAAQKDLAMGNYDLAEDSFLQFLQSNPKSDLADDARYGLAETYYARKKYQQAADEYQRVMDMNPMGGKAPAAMLKLGLCQRAAGDLREARRTWEDLIKMFPRAEEAKVAQERLREIKK